jgi:hypothetical protein
MKDLGSKCCGGYNSWDANVQPSLPPFPNPSRIEPLVKETGISSISKVNEATNYKLAIESNPLWSEMRVFFFLFQSWFFGFFGVFVAQAPVFYGMPYESIATNNYNNCWQYI